MENITNFDAHCCHMGTAIKHPAPNQVVICNFSHPDTLTSECPDVKNYKWRLNPVWHKMLYNCTHIATVGVKGLTIGINYIKHRVIQPKARLVGK